MRVFVLERVIPPLVITFELASQFCDCRDICKQSVGHVSTTKYVDSFFSNLVFVLFLFLFISRYFKKSVHGPGPKPFYKNKKVSMDPVFEIISGVPRAARSAARGGSPKAKEIYPSQKIW